MRSPVMWSGLAALSALALAGLTAYESVVWLDTGSWAPVSLRLACLELFGGLPSWVWVNGLVFQATDLPLSLWLAAATLLLAAIDLLARKRARRNSERKRMQGATERFKARREGTL